MLLSCGGRTQTRSVVCGRSDGVIVADSFCSVPKPDTSQSCNTFPCTATTISDGCNPDQFSAVSVTGQDLGNGNYSLAVGAGGDVDWPGNDCSAGPVIVNNLSCTSDGGVNVDASVSSSGVYFTGKIDSGVSFICIKRIEWDGSSCNVSFAYSDPAETEIYDYFLWGSGITPEKCSTISWYNYWGTLEETSTIGTVGWVNSPPAETVGCYFVD